MIPHTLRHRIGLSAVLAMSAATPFSHAQIGNDPAEEITGFKVAPGFEVNLFASEKEGVVKPIQMRWDERGRLWVIGSKTYPQVKPGEEPNDQVIILEDTDHDGKADRTTVFADGLMIPTGLEIAPPGNDEARMTNDVGGGNARTDVRHSSSVIRPSACYVGEGTKLCC